MLRGVTGFQTSHLLFLIETKPPRAQRGLVSVYTVYHTMLQVRRTCTNSKRNFPGQSQDAFFWTQSFRQSDSLQNGKRFLPMQHPVGN